MTQPILPSVTLDGQQFFFRVEGGPLPLDSNGVEWILTKFDGWSGRPAPRTARTDRVGHAGSFRSAGYTGPRIVSLEVIATAPDIPTMRAAEMSVEAMCSDPARLYEMVVSESGFSRSVMVELDDAILATPRLWNSTTFGLRVASPDPRKHDASWQSPIVGLGTAPSGGADFSTPGLMYATTPGVSFGVPGTPAAVSVHNAGSDVAHPFFAVTGPLAANWQIADITNGQILTYTRALSATDVVTINCDDFPSRGFPGHGVYLNTANNQRASLLTPNGWPYVLPGQTVTYNLRSASFSTLASMTVNLRSVWH
jgi:hypothetical protein